MLLQPLGWRCIECAIHYERDVRRLTPISRLVISIVSYCQSVKLCALAAQDF